ncbi:MAG: hypothetical protein P4L99_17620 [Chthoniobacter sp.]|nr:hypothetical protein [Chthoniobacter sp.]
MRLPIRFVWSLVVCLLVISVPPLSAAEKKHKAPDTLVSPDGRFRVKIEVSNGQQDSTIVDVQTGAELLPLSEAGSPWIDQGSRALWSPDSRRLAFVTPTRRGDWTDLCARQGDKWESVTLPELPEFKWPGHHADSKTVLASFSAVRWLKPNVLLLENKVEDDNGKSARVLFALTFDDQNRVTIKRVAK